MFAVPREQVVRIHASSGTTGKPTVVGYTREGHRHLGRPGGALDPRVGRARRRHRARGVRLRPVHRRPRRALRCRAARLHRDPHVGRPDREAGSADPGLPARHHHGDALVHARARSTRWKGRASTRCAARSKSASSAPSPGPPRCARRSSSALGIDAVDIYGLSEVMGPGVANECIETKDGPVVWEDHFYPEIIDPQTGEVLPDGDAGRAGVHLADQGGAAGDPLPHARPHPPAAADGALACGASTRSPAAPTTC